MDNKKALLAVSFGTSYPKTRKVTIDALEKTLYAAFPDRTGFSAWTSGFIRKKLLKTTGEKILSVEEALEAMAEDGFSDLLVVPTHLLEGNEFDIKICSVLETYKDRFAKITVARPLIADEKDAAKLAAVMEEIYAGVKENEMLVLMGHGSEKEECAAYKWLARCFEKDGHENFALGTVEFEPGFEPVIKKVRERKPEKVYLAPLLVVAGDHATNDMAGDEPDSWKNQIAAEGCEVECVLKGLGEFEQIRALYTLHAKDALA